MENRKEKILFPLAVALCVLSVYLRIHTYTTGQDPRTFLLIAKVFAGGTAPVDTRLVVPGWPLALSAVIRLFGIHAAFWTNVPLFVLLAWTVRALAEEVTGRPRRSMVVAAGAALMLLGGYALNPHFLLWAFRQTPMYLTGMLSMLCLARAVHRQAAGRLPAAFGWLAGAGLSAAAGVLVRETGVLMLPAMGLYLLANALGWAGPSAGADKPARHRWFLVGLLAAAAVAAVAAGLAAVFLFNVRLASRQGGFLVQQLPWILERPIRYSPWVGMLKALPDEFGWPGVLCLLAGIGSSLRRRHREFFFVFFLPALAYWGFDGALQRFHRRFFLSTLVFLAPLAMHGACSLLEEAWRIVRAQSAHFRAPSRRKAWIALSCAMALWFLRVWAHVQPWGPRTSRADVDRALAALSPWVGPDRPLLVDWRSRYLTDLLEVFTDWSEEVVGPKTAASCVRTPELVFARPLDGNAVCDGSVVQEIPADSILDTNVRLEEVPGASVFRLGDAAFRLERVLPWVRCRVANPLPPPPEARLFPPLPPRCCGCRPTPGRRRTPSASRFWDGKSPGACTPGTICWAYPGAWRTPSGRPAAANSCSRRTPPSRRISPPRGWTPRPSWKWCSAPFTSLLSITTFPTNSGFWTTCPGRTGTFPNGPSRSGWSNSAAPGGSPCRKAWTGMNPPRPPGASC